MRFIRGFAVAVALAVTACGGGGGGGSEGSGEGSGSTSTSTSAPTSPEQAVRDAYTGYRDAVVSRNGQAAVGYLTPAMVSYYGRMRDLALDAPEAQLVGERMVEQLVVLALRVRIDTGLLRTGAPEAIVVAAVDQGLIGDDVAQLDIGQVDVDGDRASATLTRAGTEAPTRMSFQRVDGRWRVDLQPLVDLGESVLQAAERRSGTSRKAFVERLLAGRVGAAAAARAWQPLGR